MASKIQWTGETWNPIRARDKVTGKVGWFCEHASDGCRFCYAEAMNAWRGNRIDFLRQNRDLVEVFIDGNALAKPLAWKKPRTIFPCSMTDIGAEFVTDDMLDRIWATMILCPEHTFQTLTKRPDRLRAYLSGGRARYDAVLVAGNKLRRAFPKRRLGDVPIDDPAAAAFHQNIWLGTSIEQRRHLDRLDDLRATPAAIRWVSFEPLLEDLGQINLSGISWAVIGGESGRKARPFYLRWADSIIAQCATAGVAVFMKQIGDKPMGRDSLPMTPRFDKGGDPSEWPADLRLRQFPHAATAREG